MQNYYIPDPVKFGNEAKSLEDFTSRCCFTIPKPTFDSGGAPDLTPTLNCIKELDETKKDTVIAQLLATTNGTLTEERLKEIIENPPELGKDLRSSIALFLNRNNIDLDSIPLGDESSPVIIALKDILDDPDADLTVIIKNLQAEKSISEGLQSMDAYGCLDSIQRAYGEHRVSITAIEATSGHLPSLDVTLQKKDAKVTFEHYERDIAPHEAPIEILNLTNAGDPLNDIMVEDLAKVCLQYIPTVLVSIVEGMGNNSYNPESLFEGFQEESGSTPTNQATPLNPKKEATTVAIIVAVPEHNGHYISIILHKLTEKSWAAYVVDPVSNSINYKDKVKPIIDEFKTKLGLTDITEVYSTCNHQKFSEGRGLLRSPFPVGEPPVGSY